MAVVGIQDDQKHYFSTIAGYQYRIYCTSSMLSTTIVLVNVVLMKLISDYYRRLWLSALTLAQ